MVRDVSWKPLFYSPNTSKSAHFAQKLALLILLNFFFCLLAKYFVHLQRNLDTNSILGRTPVFSPLHNGRAFLMPNALYMAAGGFRENYTLFRIVSIEIANGD